MVNKYNKPAKFQLGETCPPMKYDKSYLTNNSLNDDFIFDNIEKPFINTFTPQKNIWWAMGSKNTYFPAPDLYPLTRFEQFMHITLHFILWIPIIYYHFKNYSYMITIFFFFGLLTMVLYDFLQEENFYFGIAKVPNDKGNNPDINFTIVKSDIEQDGTSIMGSNKIYPNNDKFGYMIKSENFIENVKKHKIPLQSLTNMYEHGCENNDSTSNVNTLTSMDPEVVLAGFYILSFVITTEIINARISGKKLNTKKLPLLVCISALTMIGVYYYRMDFTPTAVSLNRIRRDKLLIESISLSLLFCSISLFRN